jgi:myo-inositol 2-dehydrogenase / D-chiro-inositol 1-dehydrogenase
VGLDDRLPLRSVEPGVTFPGGVPYPVFMERFLPAYVAELTAFIEVAAGQRPSPCTVADALETFYVAEACELSRKEHRPVLIDEVRR